MVEKSLGKNSEDRESADSIRKQLEKMNEAEKKAKARRRKTSGLTYSGATKRRIVVGKTTRKKQTLNARKSEEIVEVSAQNKAVEDTAKTAVADVAKTVVTDTEKSATLESETEKPLKEIQKDREDLPSFLLKNVESGKSRFRIPVLGSRRKTMPKLIEEENSQQEDEEVSAMNSIRNTGLAWSAAVGLFGSVVFMMAIGWLMDTLLGSEPVGIVVGIIFGSVIGFYQFFRIMSKISD